MSKKDLDLEINQSGFTLIELLSSIAVFGVLALGVASIFTEATQLSFRAQNMSKRAEGILEANTAFENLLANLVRVRDATEVGTSPLGPDGKSVWLGVVAPSNNAPLLCNCGMIGTGPTCVYDGTPTCGTDLNTPPCDNVNLSNTVGILEFDAEASPDPSNIRNEAQTSANDGCLRRNEPNTNAAPGGVSESYQFRGCKKRYRIQFQRPIKNTVVGGTEYLGQPGTLEMIEIRRNPLAPKLISKIEGVYSVRCGFERRTTLPATTDATNVPKPSMFRIDVSAKTLTSSQLFSPTAGNMESWHPLDASGQPYSGLQRGSHLSFSFQASLRNLNAVGVFFGSTQSFDKCIADGVAAFGIPPERCCSGYYDTVRCIAVDQCVQQGTSAYIGVCCSHRVNTGTGTGSGPCL